MSKVGSLTAFAAEASLWLAGAAIVAGAAGAHWDMPSVDAGSLIDKVWPGATPSLVETFTSQITASDFQASGSISGVMTANTNGTKLEVSLSGELKIKGPDSAMTLNESTNGTTATMESVTVGDSSYDRANGKAWTKSPRSSPKTDIPSLLVGGDLADKGVQTHNGQRLHRLEASKPVDPKVIALDDPSMSNTKMTLAFWAKDDGTPAGMTISGTWTQEIGGTAADATMSMDFTFEALSGVTIVAPTSASPGASSGASATPATVADRFQSFWDQWDSQYVISYTGTQSATSGKTTTESTIDGTISSSGSDCSFITGRTQGGQRSSADTITVGGNKYTRDNGSAWQKSARAATDGCTVPPFLGSRAFVYKGVETRNGAQLHRFEVADPAQFSAEWQAYAGLANVKDNLVYWVNLDGTPVAFQVSGSNDATSGGTQYHVVFTTDFTITKLSGVTITAPNG